MQKEITKTHKYRLYPNKNQIEMFDKYFGCVRFVYNRFLFERKKQYQEMGKCGYIIDKMPLDIRKWTCPNCKIEHDRDVNASINIFLEGKRETSVGTVDYTNGEDIRPISSNTNRRTSMKLEAPCFR